MKHAQNVLVHQNKIKLANFESSRKITDDSTDVVISTPTYADPKYLISVSEKARIDSEEENDKSQPYKLSPKSDVYSVGVLLWQISNGHGPFQNRQKREVAYANYLTVKIKEGRRERVVKGTPIEYSNLYQGKYYYVFIY